MKTYNYILILLCAGVAMVLTSCNSDSGISNPDVKSYHGDIYSFEISNGQVGEAQITDTPAEKKVVVTVQPGTDLTHVAPNIEISPLASIEPASGDTINFTSNDNHYTYKITASSGKTYKWNVEIDIIGGGGGGKAALKDYQTYSIRNVSHAESNYMKVGGDLEKNEKYEDGMQIMRGPLTSVTENIDRWEKWQVISDTTQIGQKNYWIRNLHSGKLLTVPENTSGDKITVVQNSKLEDGNSRQTWIFKGTNIDGDYKIISKANGQALTILDHSNQDSLNVVLAPQSNSNNQKWYFKPLAPDSYRDDNVVGFFQRNENYMGSVAFDEGTSIPLHWGPNDGKVLWITEDAWNGTSLLENDMFSCNAFFSYRNSVLIQPSIHNWDPKDTPNMTVANSAQGKPRQVFDIQPDEGFTWPGVGIEIGNKVYVQAGEGHGLSTDQDALYILTENSGTEWQVERTTTDGFSNSDIGYGTGMADGGDGYVYAFGNEGLGFGYTNYLHVARFPKDDPQDWTFWDGSNWVDQPVAGEASKIGKGLANLSVDRVNGKYVFLSMQNGFNNDDDRGKVYMSVSDSPTGPFTNKTLVYTIKEFYKGGYARYYTPAVHPEFKNGRKELLFTYCLNYGANGQGSCGVDGYRDPYFYRVKGVRVPYEMIGLGN